MAARLLGASGGASAEEVDVEGGGIAFPRACLIFSMKRYL